MQLVSSFLGTGPRVWWQLNLTGCGAAMWCPWEGRNRIRQADIQSVRIVLLSLVCVVLKFLWRKWIQQGTSISVSVYWSFVKNMDTCHKLYGNCCLFHCDTTLP
jgi:hypothetical protein